MFYDIWMTNFVILVLRIIFKLCAKKFYILMANVGTMMIIMILYGTVLISMILWLPVESFFHYFLEIDVQTQPIVISFLIVTPWNLLKKGGGVILSTSGMMLGDGSCFD